MVGISHLVGCPMVFNLLCHLIWQARLLKVMKKAQFKVFLNVCVLFPKFLDRLKNGLY